MAPGLLYFCGTQQISIKELVTRLGICRMIPETFWVS